MRFEIPTCDDRPLWDLWLSALWLPSVTAAQELGLFELIGRRPGTAQELISETGFSQRGLECLLCLLAALEFLTVRGGRYHLSDAARSYLLRDSSYFWGGVFDRAQANSPVHAAIRQAVRSGRGMHATHPAEPNRPADSWALGQIDPAQAGAITRFMQSHSLPAAVGVARNGDFAGVTRLLDVGGGSGCFAIALAQRLPSLRCTVLDLEATCQIAAEHIRTGEVADRVDTRAVDMFRQGWPTGYDAVFFSNIFHDWSLATCAQLAEKAYALLPPGGSVYVHEMLINDACDGPRAAAAFSVMMLLTTEGRQFAFAELQTLLTSVGFKDIGSTATYGYYSLVRARK